MKAIAALSVSLLLAMAPLGRAADPPPSSPPATNEAPVTRQEYEQLLREQKQTRLELDKLKAERAAPAAPAAKPPAGKELATVEDIDDISAQLKKVAETAHSGLPGTQQFIVAGDASVGFTSQNKTHSSFGAGFSPLFLFAPTEHLMFEAALDIGIGTDGTNSSSTSVDLTIANASVIVNDNLIVGGGLFVVPFGQYHNHFDPPWINKLPDDPLIFSDGGLAPGSEVGIFAKGVLPVPWLKNALPSAKVTYDVYLSNGPNLITADPSAAGQLNFDDFTDLNDGKAVGGRIAFLPHPNVEIGYSIQYSQTSPSGFQHVHALLQAVDLNWVQECRPLGGVFTTRAEWVWSQVEGATYDPTGTLGFGPAKFGNWRQGGYCTVSYRPTLSTHKWLRDTEFVFRYDTMRTPLSAPGGDHENRYTLGVDYWITPAWVLKAAYEFDNKKLGVEQSAFFVQLGIGL